MFLLAAVKMIFSSVILVPMTIQSKRVLVSEGSSLAAREIITALGLAGHRVGVCDPNAFCLGRFSRFVSHFYRCPAVGDDPRAYLDFVIAIAGRGEWDVLFPTHEQAFLFSRERAHIPSAIALAVADFESFNQIQGKAALVNTLTRLSLPQPYSRVIRTGKELESWSRYPFYLKANYTTASKAVWRIQNVEELKSRISELTSQDLLDGRREFVVQDQVEGTLERVQAVFDRGKLVAIHGYQQVIQGPGGGDIAKISLLRPIARHHLERLGEELQWHGALSMDYIFRADGQGPAFIDANPRLIEPMNAVFSGVNLADILVRVTTGQLVAAEQVIAGEARTHLLLMALLSAAAARKRRVDIISELLRAMAGRGFYEDSREELLPVRIDFKCLIPLVYAMVRLLLRPGLATALSAQSIASYSLSTAAAQQIADGSIPLKRGPLSRS